MKGLNVKDILFIGILVIYLDWSRLFGDIQRIITVITTEVQTHDKAD